MKIIRVFVRRTSSTPTDEWAFIGEPPMIRPEADEVKISVVFTWDIESAKHLALAWAQYYSRVTMGGPALCTYADGFTPGLFTHLGITITSRGCNNNCPWCLVPQREGNIREIPICPGNIIQDNNLLQCSSDHIHKVFDMLKTQRHVQFTGGLDARLLTNDIVDRLRSIRLEQMFFACDNKASIAHLRKAGEMLKDIPRSKKRCYVLLAFDGESISDCTERLQDVWQSGFMPFAQLYQPADHRIVYSNEWRTLARNWSRPAIMKTIQSKHYCKV